jgi:prevent-host-death family protein
MRLDRWPCDGYLGAMSSHSVADAKNQLSNLIDRALKGEGVIITRRGQPVVELRPVRPAPRPVTEADIEWLRQMRAKLPYCDIDAGTFVSQMRDEEDDR